MSKQKGMSEAEIRARVKKSGSYINLKPNQIVAIVLQLPPEDQVKCFSGAKTINLLDNIETSGIVAIYGLAPKDTPISKLTVEEKRKLIKDAIKDIVLAKFLEDNGLMERASILKEQTLPGDFAPRKFWNEVIQNYVGDELDLSDPDAKEE